MDIRFKRTYGAQAADGTWRTRVESTSLPGVSRNHPEIDAPDAEPMAGDDRCLRFDHERRRPAFAIGAKDGPFSDATAAHDSPAESIHG